MGKAPPDVPPAKLELYDKLLATNPDVRRKGAASAYTSLNGHMFSFMTKTGTLALRLPKEEREAFLKKHKTQLCVVYNTVMKEYVEVPDALLKNTRKLKRFFDISYDYVGGLKPKPTTRKKKAASTKKPKSSKRKVTKTSKTRSAGKSSKRKVAKTGKKRTTAKSSKRKVTKTSKKRVAAKRKTR